MSELQRLQAGHAAEVLAFELANRAYFAASVSDRGDAYFDQFTERYSALLAEEEAGTGACYVLVAEDGSVLGRFNLIFAGDGTAELGYRVARHVAGRGVATATVRELCRLAPARHALRTLRAATSRANVASQQVLTKAGFVPVGPAHLGGKPGTWYQRDLSIGDGQRDPPGAAAPRGNARLCAKSCEINFLFRLLLISVFLRRPANRAAYREGMPNLTVTHEAPLELIRQHPALAVDLLRAFTGLTIPDQADVRLGPNSLNAIVPAEFTADAVVIASDSADGRPQVVIVVEPQGRDDETKRYAWPAYLANVRSATRCPTAVLLVICPDPREADKCRHVIAMGHPGWDLWPIVIDPQHAPAAEGAGPYLTLFLACLPALDMADPAIARRVLDAIRETGASDADRRKLVTIILKRASDAARLILEDLMTAIEWKDDWVESFVNEGIAKGLEQGAVRAKVTDIMKVLAVRDLHPTKKQLARVAACSDLATLDRWFDRSLTAANAAEVFAD